jgi:hypothetical protein
VTLVRSDFMPSPKVSWLCVPTLAAVRVRLSTDGARCPRCSGMASPLDGDGDLYAARAACQAVA